MLTQLASANYYEFLENFDPVYIIEMVLELFKNQIEYNKVRIEIYLQQEPLPEDF